MSHRPRANWWRLTNPGPGYVQGHSIAVRMASGRWKRALYYGVHHDGHLSTSAGFVRHTSTRPFEGTEPWHGARGGMSLPALPHEPGKDGAP